MKKNHHKTAQRVAILKYLNSNKHHPNIIDIYNNVSKKISTISKTTVYNTIDLLIKEGLIHEVAVRNHEGRRFESNRAPHDHLICNICVSVVDVKVDVDQSSLLTEKLQQGFEINEIYIDFYGVCRNCKNMDSKSK